MTPEPDLQITMENMTKYPTGVEAASVYSNQASMAMMNPEAQLVTPEYLEDLVTDFAKFGLFTCVRSVERLGNTEVTTSPTHTSDQCEAEESTAQERLLEIIQEVRKIRDSSNPFLSKGLKRVFFAKMATLSEWLASLNEDLSALRRYKKLEEYISVQRALATFPTLSASIPYYHPRYYNGQLPWNKWLDNSATPRSGRAEIQQKIPFVGECLLQKIALKYDFKSCELLDQNKLIQPFDSEEELETSGEAFKHMTWSGFSSVPNYQLGFTTGQKDLLDREEPLSLECISEVACSLIKDASVPTEVSSIQYYRWAVGYQLAPADRC